MENRILIKNLEQSSDGHSIIKTGSDGSQQYLSPGQEGAVLKVISGIPTWANDSGNFVGVYADSATRDSSTDLNGVNFIDYGPSQTGNFCKLLDDGSLDADGTPNGIAKTYIWDGTQWIDFSIDPRLLNDLTDVKITSATSSQILTFVDTDWVNTSRHEENFKGLTSGNSVTASNLPIRTVNDVYLNGQRQILEDDYTVDLSSGVFTWVDVNEFEPSVGGTGVSNITIKYEI